MKCDQCSELASMIACCKCDVTGNVYDGYNEKDDIIGTNEKGDREMGDIIADITTSFVVLAGIFFPSVTGI